MNMKIDGFTQEEIRKTQKQELVGRSEAVRLLKKGEGWKKPVVCEHTYGYHFDAYGWVGLVEDKGERMTTPFKYCPKCGEKL